MMKRRLGRIMVALAVAGLGVLGMPSPASADAPTLDYGNVCGAVRVTVTGVSPIEVKRNGTTIGITTAGISTWGASPGDTISVLGFEATHAYSTPEGCTFPDLNIGLELGCQGIVILKVNNSGPAVASGFSIGTQELDPFPVGESTHEEGVDPGPFALIREFDGEEHIWLSGYYAEPKGCGPETVEAKFTDSCGKIKIDVSSDIEEVQGVLVVKGDGVIDILFFSSGSPASKEYDAVAGDEFAIYYPLPDDEPEGPEAKIGAKMSAEPVEGFELIADHTHNPPICGDLPVTGMKIGAAVLAGLLLIAAGAGLFVIARRRRLTNA